MIRAVEAQGSEARHRETVSARESPFDKPATEHEDEMRVVGRNTFCKATPPLEE